MSIREAARVDLPTSYGTFEVRAFECSTGFVYLALIAGEVAGGRRIPTRVHSECLTGEALGSLRCDCGVQLRSALRAIAAQGRGVLVYATGHEGRGVGLVGKLRAYIEQDAGLDTVDANVRLGLPVDGRTYDDAAAVIGELGIRSVVLMTNNPGKVDGLRSAGVDVEAVRGVPVAAHARNLAYLSTKQVRLGHLSPAGTSLPNGVQSAFDVGSLLGDVTPTAHRPHVTVKYAQSIDGRIATAAGDSKWISGEQERAVSHALRGRCDAVMVGIGTVLRDDPQLTVRLVPGQSPMRVVLDSRLRIPLDARLLDDDAPTTVITTSRAPQQGIRRLRSRDVAVRVVPRGPGGVDIERALRALCDMGVASLLVEGGAGVVTSLLDAGIVDRAIVSIAPIVLGSGIEGVGDLGVPTVRDSINLCNVTVHTIGDDIVVASDVRPARRAARPRPEDLRV